MTFVRLIYYIQAARHLSQNFAAPRAHPNKSASVKTRVHPNRESERGWNFLIFSLRAPEMENEREEWRGKKSELAFSLATPGMFFYSEVGTFYPSGFQ